MSYFLPHDKVIVPAVHPSAVIKNVSERYTTMSSMGQWGSTRLLLLHVLDGAE